MTRFDTYQPGTPCWTDLTTTDREQAMAFYGRVLGWDFTVGPAETNHYTMCTVDGALVAAINQPPEDTGYLAWTTYLATDDLDATVAKVTEHGGSVLFGPIDVMEQGRLALAADPTGAVVGLWQGLAMPGAAVANEAGSFTWHEVWTPDAAAATSFYAAVLGLGLEPMPGGADYTLLKVGDRAVAGVLGAAGMPAEAPAHWLPYLAVDDPDATTALAEQHGATVVSPPRDSDFGRIAIITDPQGARLALVTTPAG